MNEDSVWYEVEYLDGTDNWVTTKFTADTKQRAIAHMARLHHEHVRKGESKERYRVVRKTQTSEIVIEM